MATDDLRESVRHLPDQLRDIAVAAADLDQLPDAEGIASVVVLGTGGARVAGDVIEAICELRATVPIVATGARCPAWVSDRTLAIVVSPSGDDPGVVAAAEAALDTAHAIVVVTSGGALGTAAAAWGVPVVPIDPDAGPAAGLGAAIVPVLVLLERLGFVSGMTRTVSDAATQIAERLDSLFDSPRVRLLAERELDWKILSERITLWRDLLLEAIDEDPFLGDPDVFRSSLEGPGNSLKTIAGQRRNYLLQHPSIKKARTDEDRKS